MATIVITDLLASCCCYLCADVVGGKVEVHPNNLNATNGQEVVIQCTTEAPTEAPYDYDYGVEWEFLSNNSETRMAICPGSGTYVLDEVVGKYECTNLRNNHSLIIVDVGFNDSGTYFCIEDAGRGPGKDSARLTVLRK